jgi:hypothetical protein
MYYFILFLILDVVLHGCKPTRECQVNLLTADCSHRGLALFSIITISLLSRKRLIKLLYLWKTLFRNVDISCPNFHSCGFEKLNQLRKIVFDRCFIRYLTNTTFVYISRSVTELDSKRSIHQAFITRIHFRKIYSLHLFVFEWIQ